MMAGGYDTTSFHGIVCDDVQGLQVCETMLILLSVA